MGGTDASKNREPRARAAGVVPAWGVAAAAALVGLVATAAAPAGPATPPTAAATVNWQPVAKTVLRVARSADGLRFGDTGRVFATRASAPDLVRLADGDLLAIFDCIPGESEGQQPVLAVSRSADEGETWSAAKLVRLHDERGRLLAGRHGDLIRRADGRLQLFFAVADRPASREADQPMRHRTQLRTAVTRNGIDYRCAGGGLPAGVGVSTLHPTALQWPSEVELLADDLDQLVQREAGHATPRATFRARDGGPFTRARSRRWPEDAAVSNLTRVREGVRAFLSTPGGITSLLSTDGQAWSAEPGVRVPGGWDAAVIACPDGSYLMIYCAPASGDGDGSAAGALVGGLAEADVALASALQAGEPVTVEPVDEADAPNTLELIGDAPTTNDAGFAAVPDFQQRVDYVAWWYDVLVPHADDNAYLLYKAAAGSGFLPPPLQDDADAAPLPDLFNMFHDPAFDGPPRPWSPADHPDWAAASIAAREAVARFAEAASHPGYQYPLPEDVDHLIRGPNGEPCLINLMLPSLSYYRRLTEQVLADAWQEVDGEVPAQGMLDAWDTTLRSAYHLDQSSTLIEELVSLANRSKIERTARWALAENVFQDEQQLQVALDTLIELDVGSVDPQRLARAEHAYVMDAIQYLYWPTAADGEPRFSEERARAIRGVFGDEEEKWLDTLRTLPSQDVHEAVAAIDEYYRSLEDEMRVGYPEVRSADIHALRDQYAGTNPLTELFVPNLSRVHAIRARGEANRRATQLAYASRLFKERTGRWPTGLDEVAAQYGEEMVTDPFTGGYFGYRVGEAGPTIYSCSENGVDDGGLHAPTWGQRPEEAASDDYVFWPPQPR